MEWLGLSVESGFWNTIWIALLIRASRSSTGIWLISLPESVTMPSVPSSMPVSTLARVDLPQPDSPTIARVWPRLAERSMLSTACTS